MQISQIVISLKFSKTVYAFTKQGVAMLSTEKMGTTSKIIYRRGGTGKSRLSKELKAIIRQLHVPIVKP